jgi:hypothetical protein
MMNRDRVSEIGSSVTEGRSEISTVVLLGVWDDRYMTSADGGYFE